MKLRTLWLALQACSIVLGLGCLEQDGVERARYSPNLLAEGARVPRIEDDERLRKRIDAADNLDSMQVALHSAFADGQPVTYLDFGTAQAMARPIWQFRRRNAAGEAEDFGHLDLVDLAPGDTGYSPFRQQYQVFVTEAYDGERITSLPALEDALELGLLEEPVPLASYIDCPMVLANTVIEEGSAVPPPLELRPIYYRGHVATCFAVLGEDFGVKSFPLDERGRFTARSVYALRRQDESRALDEMVWSADLNGDGDKRDSNQLFTLSPMQPGFAALWKFVDVVVAPDYAFEESRSEGDLFTREMLGLTAITPPVIEYQDSTVLKNLVVWSEAP